MHPFPFSLHPRETPHAWVHRTVTGLVHAAINHSTSTTAALTETVHLIRTTVKRLRSLLRLLRPVLPPPFFTRENTRLQTAARRLAAGRDQTVLLQTLAGLAAAASDDNDRATLSQIKKLASQKLRPSAHPVTLRTIQTSRRSLTTFQRALFRINLTGTPWPSLALTGELHRARQRMKKAVKTPGPESFHSWRIAVKRIYYQFQWLAPLWPKKLSSAVPLLNHLEDALGAEHDLWILHEKMAALPLDPPAAKALTKAIKHRSRHLRRRAKSLGKRLFQNHPRRFERKLVHHATAWQETL